MERSKLVSTPAGQRARINAACSSIKKACRKHTASIKKSYVIDSTHYNDSFFNRKPRPPFDKPFHRG